MSNLRVLLIPLLLVAATADARPGDAGKAGRGANMPLPKIEERVVPRMRGATYLGPEVLGDAVTYRLKFIRNGKVIWVDVDARTGRILGVTE